MAGKGVKVGASNHCPVWLDAKVRQTHMHVIGLSRTGKSKFLEHLIREDILAGNGVCLIDPHGTLYDEIVAWLAMNGLHKSERIHLINPSDENWTVGFNPLISGSADLELSVRIDMMVDACVKVWDGDDINKTPLLGRCLQLLFGAMAQKGLTLVEWQYLTNWSMKHHRATLPEEIDDPILSLEWLELEEGLDKREFVEAFNSTRNRLLQFTKAPVIRDIMGQTENVIDWKRCMDEGHVVLVNLRPSARLSKHQGQLLGAFINNALYGTAFTRDAITAARKPFYCYIDECAQYLTKDVANALDETAKYGLHFVLSHQRLQQLADSGPELLNAVWAGAQVKVVFNCDDETMAEPLAKHLFRKEFDLTRVKGWITQPVVVGYETIWLEGESETVTESEASGDSSMTGTGTSNSTGIVTLYDANGHALDGWSQSESFGDSFSDAASHSHSHSESLASATSRSEALRPILEERALTPISLDEHVHEGIVAIRRLKQRQAFLYHRDIGTIPIEAPYVRTGKTFPDELIHFGKMSNQKSEFTARRVDVRAELQRRLDHLNGHSGMATDDRDPGEFFE